MKRFSVVVMATAALLASQARAKSPQEIFAENSGAMGIVEMNIDAGDGPDKIVGPGICIHLDQEGRAIFLTTAFGIQTPLDGVSGLTVRPSGLDTKKTPASVMGVDPVTGMAFVRTTTATKWTKVQFVGKRSGLKIGQQVVSIGVQNASSGHEPYLGVAYVSGRVRVPEVLYRVTGGTLTATCSAVFNLDGKVVGIVARQLPTTYQMMTQRGQTYVGMTGQDQKSYFLPIDEFADSLASMPSPGAPRRRVWTGVVSYIPVTDDDAKTYGVKVPAIMLGKVVKGGPADRAGLKERDLVIGLAGKQLEKFATPSLVGKRFLNQLQTMAFNGTKQAALTLKRGEKEFSANVALVPIPKQAYEAERYICKELGLAFREKVPPDSYTDTSPTASVEGLIVIAAPEKGPGGRAGVRRGDLLIQINGETVTTVLGARDLMGKALAGAPSKAIVLMVQRGDKTYPISVTRTRN